MIKGKVNGYLSVYISLTLIVMISLFMVMLDGARRSCIRLETECAVDVGLNNVLAEYHRELFEQYNLFYIDSSYGTAVPTYCNTQARLQMYVEENINVEKAAYLDFVYKDFCGIEMEDCYIERVLLATDESGKCFQENAAKIMLDEMGIGLVNDVLGWAGIVDANEMSKYDVEKEYKKVNQDIEEIINKKKEEDAEGWLNIDFTYPLEYVAKLCSEGVLACVLENSQISSQRVDLSQYISARRRNGIQNRGNADFTRDISVAEKILFYGYVMKHAGYYGQEKQGSQLKYQVEYVLCGQDSDRDNIGGTLTKLCRLRGASNLIYLYGDEEKMNAAKVAAQVLTLPAPEFADLAEAAIVLGWAFAESIYDLKVLVSGGKVPLLKQSNDWHYDLDSIFQSVDMNIAEVGKKGLAYQDYLILLLYMTNDEKATFRFMDLIEMDIRSTEGNANFRMDGCIEWLEVKTVFRSRSGYKHSVRMNMGYE